MKRYASICRMMTSITDEQIREAIAAARMPEPLKVTLLKQAIEQRDPGARLAASGLFVRQHRA